MQRFETLERRLALSCESGWNLQPSETDPGATDLVWCGTEGLDVTFFLPTVTGDVLIFTPIVGGLLDESQVDIAIGVTGRIVAEGKGGADILVAEFMADIDVDLRGGDGDDLIYGGMGSDVLRGDDGIDILVGGARAVDGNDTLLGGDGKDILLGWLGDDQLDGGDDDDVLMAGTLDTPDLLATLSSIKFGWINASEYGYAVAAVQAVGGFLSDGGQKGINLADPLATGLEAAWTFRGNADDLTGNGHDGTLINGPEWALDPQQGGVIDLDPSGGPQSEQYISIPDDPALDRQDNWSVSILVKLDDDFTAQPRTLFVKRSSGPADEGGWAITYGIHGAANHNRFQATEFKGAGGSAFAWNTESSIAPFGEDEWTMITVVFANGGLLEGGTTSIYINGVYDVDRLRNGVMLWNNDLAIGARPLNPGAAWDGQLGVAYFHAGRALTAQEAAELAADPDRLILPQDLLFGGEGNDWYAMDSAVEELIDREAGEVVWDLAN